MSFNTLNPGNLIIALRTGKQDVILGEGTSTSYDLMLC